MNDTWKAIVTISGFAEGYNIKDGDSEFMGACFAIPYEVGNCIQEGNEITTLLGGRFVTSILLEKEYDTIQNLIIVRTIIKKIE